MARLPGPWLYIEATNYIVGGDFNHPVKVDQIRNIRVNNIVPTKELQFHTTIP